MPKQPQPPADQVTLGKSLISPGFPSPTPNLSLCFVRTVAWMEDQGFLVWPLKVRALQGRPGPVLSSQLHLGVAMCLPLGSMGSHYHRYMLMTPINSPSVGPMQPSVLKVKRRGIGSGRFFPRMTVQACVYQHMYSSSLCCLVYREHVHASLVTCVYTSVLCVCALGIQGVLCTKCKSYIYICQGLYVFCVYKVSAYKLCLYVCTQCRAHIWVQMLYV